MSELKSFELLLKQFSEARFDCGFLINRSLDRYNEAAEKADQLAAELITAWNRRTPEPGQPEAGQKRVVGYTPETNNVEISVHSQPEQGDSWFRVEVSDGAGQIVAIESEMLAGREIGEHEDAVIRKCIAHLSGFIGAGLASERGEAEPVADLSKQLWSLFEYGQKDYRGCAKETIEEILKSYTRPAPRATVPDKLQELANRVCRDLPDGMEIQLCMENGAAYIDLISPHIEVDFEECPDSSLSARIEDALQKAIAAAPEQGGVG